jgi:general secretion pathway protein J
MKSHPRRSHSGFTLVELLVSLMIFGMLSAAGVALLTFSVRAQGGINERQQDLARLRRMGALLTSDLAQAAPRISRDRAGAVQPAFLGGAASISLVRRGWENFDGSARPSLQKVEYRLAQDRLERVPYRFVDGASAMSPMNLFEGVRSLRLRYRDKEGRWRDRWDPPRITDMPQAVEMVLDVEGRGATRQLFLVGTGA